MTKNDTLLKTKILKNIPWLQHIPIKPLQGTTPRADIAPCW